MIGIIGAMHCEVEQLRERLTNRKTTVISGISFDEGELNGKAVVVAESGIGKVCAAVCAQTMIMKYNPQYLINTGCAGTAVESQHIGDVSVSLDCVQHDCDTTCLGDKPGEICSLKRVSLPASKMLADAVADIAGEMNIHCTQGTIASGDQFISTNERRQWIRETFNAVTVEMESASIAQVCCMNGTEFVAIRVISDEASGDAQHDFAAFSVKAAHTSIAITEKLVARL